MSEKKLFLAVLLPALLVSSSAFGWMPTKHASTATNICNYWTIQPFLSKYGLNANVIAAYAVELDLDSWRDTYHHNWSMLSERSYLYAPWDSLSEERRVGFIIHNATDSGVPLGHSPANLIWSNDTKETALETVAEHWSLPPVTTYTGTYAQQLEAHYGQVITNAIWAQTNWGNPVLDWEDYKTAGWAGLIQGQAIAVGALLDYFLSKEPTVANANGLYSANPGGSITFSSAGSYDPDSITIGAGGTYSNNGGGFTCDWDIDNNGTYETPGANPTLSHAQLVSMLGYSEAGHTVRLRVADTEPGAAHSTATDTAIVRVYSNPIAEAGGSYGVYSVYEGGTVQLNSTGSCDPDGGWEVRHWDVNNDGVYDTDNEWFPTFSYNTWTPSEAGHTVKLRVTDNEGVQATDTAIVRVLSNPIAEAGGSYGVYSVYEGGTVQLNSTGSYDPDGGWEVRHWDVNNDGVYDTDNVWFPTFSYGTWAPSEAGHTVTLRVTDNEGQVGYDTAIVRVLSNPIAEAGGSYGVYSVYEGDNAVVQFNSTGTYDPDGGWEIRQWDMDDDGIYETDNEWFPIRPYSTWAPSEAGHTVTLRVTDNEGQVSYDTAIVRVLSVPDVMAYTRYEVHNGENLFFFAWGQDLDGGGIVSWLWDLDNDGQYDDASGLVTLSYNDLLAMGLATDTQLPISLKVIDNDGQIGYSGSYLTLWSSGSVPEPATLSLLAVGGLALLRRKK